MHSVPWFGCPQLSLNPGFAMPVHQFSRCRGLGKLTKASAKALNQNGHRGDHLGTRPAKSGGQSSLCAVVGSVVSCWFPTVRNKPLGNDTHPNHHPGGINLNSKYHKIDRKPGHTKSADQSRHQKQRISAQRDFRAALLQLRP